MILGQNQSLLTTNLKILVVLSRTFLGPLFPGIFLGSLFIFCTSAAPQRQALGSLPSPVATHLRTERVCLGRGRSRIQIMDQCFPVMHATMYPPLFLRDLLNINVRGLVMLPRITLGPTGHWAATLLFLLCSSGSHRIVEQTVAFK